MKCIVSFALLLLSLSAIAGTVCTSEDYASEMESVFDPSFWTEDTDKLLLPLYVLAEAKQGADWCTAENKGKERLGTFMTGIAPLAQAVEEDENLNPYIADYFGGLIAKFSGVAKVENAPVPAKPLKQLIVRLVDEFVSTAISITSTTGGCIDVAQANAYFQELFEESYVPLTELCIKKNRNSSEVNWKWQRSFDVDPQSLPVSFGSYNTEYPAMVRIEKEGSIEFKERKRKLSLDIDGFSLFLKAEKVGSLRFVNATVKGLSIADSDSSVRLHLMTMGVIPFSVKLGADEEGSPYAKIFGFNLIKSE